MFINCRVGQVSESWWIKFTWRYFHCSSDMFFKVSGSVINLIWEVLDSLCALSGNKKDKSLLECLRKRVFCHLWYSIQLGMLHPLSLQEGIIYCILCQVFVISLFILDYISWRTKYKECTEYVVNFYLSIRSFTSYSGFPLSQMKRLEVSGF